MGTFLGGQRLGRGHSGPRENSEASPMLLCGSEHRPLFGPVGLGVSPVEKALGALNAT